MQFVSIRQRISDSQISTHFSAFGAGHRCVTVILN
jgi:hypothetical protein